MHSISVTNNSGKTIIIKTEGDATVSEDTRCAEMPIESGSSAVLFTERLQRATVEIA